LKVIRIQTVNGGEHYIVRSLKKNENPVDGEDFDETDIRRIMKEEASRRVLPVRAE
jgi:hypothetical protein